MSLWYLSFATEAGWLGGAFVDADDLVDAAVRAHVLGCNPGGEVMGHDVPDDAPRPEPSDIGRLLTREELERINKRAATLAGCPELGDTLSLVEAERKYGNGVMSSVCEEHNVKKPS